jgi:hypothetical protein
MSSTKTMIVPSALFLKNTILKAFLNIVLSALFMVFTAMVGIVFKALFLVFVNP